MINTLRQEQRALFSERQLSFARRVGLVIAAQAPRIMTANMSRADRGNSNETTTTIRIARTRKTQ